MFHGNQDKGSPSFLKTPTGTMTVGGGTVPCTCSMGGIVEQYSLGLLGLGLGVTGLFFSNDSAEKKLRKCRKKTNMKTSGSEIVYCQCRVIIPRGISVYT